MNYKEYCFYFIYHLHIFLKLTKQGSILNMKTIWRFNTIYSLSLYTILINFKSWASSIQYSPINQDASSSLHLYSASVTCYIKGRRFNKDSPTNLLNFLADKILYQISLVTWKVTLWEWHKRSKLLPCRSPHDFIICTHTHPAS